MNRFGPFIQVKDEREVFAIGDIHGCVRTLKALLEEIDYKGQSPLFLLGDYVNKGPSSAATLDFIIELKNTYPKVYPLAGNHDHYLLWYLTRNDLSWLTSPEHGFIEKAGEFDHLTPAQKLKYAGFIQSLPLYYETENTYFVHAGFNFERRDIMEDTEAMTTIRAFHYNAPKAHHKQIVHGHFPVELPVIRRKIERHFPVIPLDNGCVYSGKRNDMGSLCCLELKQMKLHTKLRMD